MPSLRFFRSPRPLWPQGLSVVRLLTGLLIAYHGRVLWDASKMAGMADWLGTDLHLPAPFLMAYLAKGAEFFGGLLLAIGLATRIASVLLLITMAVATFGAHASDILGEGESALLYLLLFLTFLSVGPGPWSVDHLRHPPADHP